MSILVLRRVKHTFNELDYSFIVVRGRRVKNSSHLCPVQAKKKKINSKVLRHNFPLHFLHVLSCMTLKAIVYPCFSVNVAIISVS